MRKEVIKRGKKSKDGQFYRTKAGVLLQIKNERWVEAKTNKDKMMNKKTSKKTSKKTDKIPVLKPGEISNDSTRLVVVSPKKPAPVKSKNTIPYSPDPSKKLYPCSRTSITTALGSTLNLIYFQKVGNGQPQLRVEMLSKPKKDGTRTQLEFAMSMEALGALFLGSLQLGAVPVQPPIQKPVTGV